MDRFLEQSPACFKSDSNRDIEASALNQDMRAK
jgi:hypothetical protein